MRKCPDCGIEIRADSCNACGWAAKPKQHPYKWAVKVVDQWVDLQCAWDEHGVQCEKYGTISPATNGTGPWYCRQHYGFSGPGRQPARAGAAHAASFLDPPPPGA